jgi:hypothetical protein
MAGDNKQQYRPPENSANGRITVGAGDAVGIPIAYEDDYCRSGS